MLATTTAAVAVFGLTVDVAAQAGGRWLLVTPPPIPEKRALMMRPEDVAGAIVYVASQPPRVNVEQILIRPTLDQVYPGAAEVLARWQQAANR